MKTFLTLLCCGMTATVFAQDKLKPTSVNLFKNGTYFVVREGEVPVKNSNWSFPAPMNPLLGTIWFTTTKEANIRRVDFLNDTIKTSRQARSWIDIARTAKGKKVRLLYVQTEQQVKEVKGTLLDVFPETNTMKVKSDDGGLLFLFASKVLELHVDGATEDHFKADSIARVAKIYFSRETGSLPLKVTYMSTGMMWHPSYNIKIIDDRQLQLELKALVENFSEKLENTDLTLTVGAPQFRYGMQLDPSALQGFRGSSGINAGATNTYRYQNYAPTAAMADEESRVQIDYNDYSQYNTLGEKSDDVYRYRLGKVSIPLNTKASFSIFSANIPYEDIYECTVSDYINLASARYINNNPENRFPVFHSLRLTNNTSFPFTTGPAFVLDEKLEPLAQDIVNYTPTSGKTKVQLSKAQDVYVTNTEEEKGKESNAKVVNRTTYSLVTVRGSIPVENLQPKSISLNITKFVNGKITDVSDGGTINKPGRYSGLNAQTSAEWTVKLAANEKKTITYTYQVYVANY